VSLLGTHLTMLIGPSVPVPAPVSFLEALDSVTVTHSDEGRSGFQIQFRAGRSASDLLDYALLSNPLLKPFNRVVLVVTFGAVPQVLMDGMITDQQFSPSSQPGASKLTVTGEDVSVMMDLEEKSVEHPAQPEAVIALKLIGSYAQYGLIPMVLPPPAIDVPLPTERIPVQQSTDLEYLQELAERFGYVFYVTAGPAPLANTAYWGPPVRAGVPQRAITVNMGPNTNAEISNARYDSMAATFVEGQVQDRRAGEVVPVQTFASTRLPLVSQPAWATQAHVRTRQFRQSGLDTMQALTRAQAETDASTDSVVEVTGELDADRYGALLQPRGLVGVRGAGYSYDGFYYVKSVTHNVRKGEYKQSFTLTREGLGAISPVVIP
jgi:hypothetical protein